MRVRLHTYHLNVHLYKNAANSMPLISCLLRLAEKMEKRVWVGDGWGWGGRGGGRFRSSSFCFFQANDVKPLTQLWSCIFLVIYTCFHFCLFAIKKKKKGRRRRKKQWWTTEPTVFCTRMLHLGLAFMFTESFSWKGSLIGTGVGLCRSQTAVKKSSVFMSCFTSNKHCLSRI